MVACWNKTDLIDWDLHRPRSRFILKTPRVPGGLKSPSPICSEPQTGCGEPQESNTGAGMSIRHFIRTCKDLQGCVFHLSLHPPKSVQASPQEKSLSAVELDSCFTQKPSSCPTLRLNLHNRKTPKTSPDLPPPRSSASLPHSLLRARSPPNA